jgi:hypothetical protein
LNESNVEALLDKLLHVNQWDKYKKTGHEVAISSAGEKGELQETATICTVIYQVTGSDLASRESHMPFD